MPRARKPALDDLVSGQHGEVADLMRQQGDTPAPFIGPDEVPNLSDPSSRPNEPVTTGLPIGDGEGPEVLGAIDPDPVRKTLQAMLLVNPNNDIMRLIDILDSMGR